MSTYVLMRIFESTPRRYELGIRCLTLGRLDKAYERLAGFIEPGQQVLDLGCGTGALSLRAARRGARVKGIDIDIRMLEIAKQRVSILGLGQNVDLVEMGVAQLDREESNRYDAVMSGLCFSELSDDELTYALREARRVLRQGGFLLIADEVQPEGVVKRLIHSTLRAPLAALAYALTQRTTRPVSNLPRKLIDAGLSVVSVRFNPLSSLGEIAAQKPA